MTISEGCKHRRQCWEATVVVIALIGVGERSLSDADTGAVDEVDGTGIVLDG